jgi:hypothetical protein
VSSRRTVERVSVGALERNEVLAALTLYSQDRAGRDAFHSVPIIFFHRQKPAPKFGALWKAPLPASFWCSVEKAIHGDSRQRSQNASS